MLLPFNRTDIISDCNIIIIFIVIPYLFLLTDKQYIVTVVSFTSL